MAPHSSMALLCWLFALCLILPAAQGNPAGNLVRVDDAQPFYAPDLIARAATTTVAAANAKKTTTTTKKTTTTTCTTTTKKTTTTTKKTTTTTCTTTTKKTTSTTTKSSSTTTTSKSSSTTTSTTSPPVVTTTPSTTSSSTTSSSVTTSAGPTYQTCGSVTVNTCGYDNQPLCGYSDGSSGTCFCYETDTGVQCGSVSNVGLCGPDGSCPAGSFCARHTCVGDACILPENCQTIRSKRRGVTFKKTGLLRGPG